MRSTVSDSSGNPENRKDPEYGEERYGAVPVREWVGPGGAGLVTDAWAAAGERAAADRAPEGRDPVAAGVTDAGEPTASGPDSVVDLVLDLVPGDGDRVGSAFGATSASVSVPAGASESAGAGAEIGAEVAALVVDADVAEVSAPLPVVSDLLPAPAPEAGTIAALPEAAMAASVAEAEADVRAEAEAGPLSVGDPEAAVPVPVTVPESGVLVLSGARTGARGPVADPAPPAPAPEARTAGAGRDDASGRATVPGPAPALSFSYTGADTGELRTDTWGDTGRHQAVIATERTASIPVHLLFRDDPEAGTDAAALPAGLVRRTAGGEQPPGVRRPAVPRTPQVRPSTRPSPDADPRLHERPGPALPGWVALLTGLGGIAAAGAVLWWTGALPAGVLSRLGIGPRPYDGLGTDAWAALAVLVTVVLFALGGLSRGRVGYAWVLTLFGQYRGSVRRTGLMWVSPLLLRRRVDVRLRHWRSEPLPAMDANGTALRVVVLVVWRVKDTVRATLGIEDHEEYLREQVESAMARVLSQLPADAFHEDAHTLRNAEAVGDALTRMLKADCEPVGIEVYSAQPTGIEYAPEVAAAMQRRRIAAIDAKHRDSVLTSVVDAVDDTVNRLTARGLVALDDYERKSLVKDLTVAFYTGRSGGEGA
ncbi:SPFH domain-containing protein [Streptomyces sp. NBC_00876]|uniref:SPFH domain-containing protein n=1 Tax=Streptomyces sp. NBC_00876 TaxID=2975853 RepID=UPI00386C351C|nr:SPFH domain-containing protein [Streptomyces sp. NBC_00876]